MSEFSALDCELMDHALGLAALGMNTTDPNPRVGCVLVRGGRIVGEGWHERAGGPHAEAQALAAAGDAARTATAYVTLEPCASTGRVSPCADALIHAGVARVIYGIGDPNPAKNGGAARLRSAGVMVDGGLQAEAARALNPGFHKRHETGLPWVRVKLAASLDGRTALANGASRWITGPVARRDGQLFRARSSVVLTGAGTIEIDDPELNVRLDGAIRQPLRVVLDSRLRSPPEARVFAREGPCLIYTTSTDKDRRTALIAAGAEVVVLPEDATGRVALRAVLENLAARSANEIWIEAGATLAGAFIAVDLVDELVVYLAPCLLGGTARGLAELPEIRELEQRRRLRFTSTQMLGDDLRLTARVLRAGEP
jgi:diaminohydroxyphosphoribosylaminopyrimidine deaminase/5-amino-6-(5-phosphoribosylamino)uracil reductase